MTTLSPAIFAFHRTTLRLLLPVSFLIGFFIVAQEKVNAGSKILTATADTYVGKDIPSTNFGSSMSVGLAPATDIIGLLKFDVSSIPAGSVVSSATLRIYITSLVDNGQIYVLQVASSWEESTVTWNNRPGFDTPVINGGTPNTVNAWWEMNVTDIVKEWITDGIANYGFYLSTSTGVVNFSSKESANDAELVIQYSTGAFFHASGQVTSSNTNTGISVVKMTFTRNSGSGAIPVEVYTDAQGNWSQSGFEAGTSYRVTPSGLDYTYTPVFRDFQSTGADLTGRDFTALTYYSVIIHSIPSGATVHQNGPTGPVLGTTPLTLNNLESNTGIALVLDGFRDSTFTVTWKDRGKTKDISLRALTDAMIVGFSPPTGILQRGVQTQTIVRVRNTSGSSRSFWVGLSFADKYATNSGWPLHWYDIKPIQTRVLANNEEQNLVFTVLIAPNLLPGQYYAAAAVWDEFDEVQWILTPPRIVDTRENDDWRTRETGLQSFSLGAFPRPAQGVLSDLRWGVQYLLFGSQDLTTAYMNTQAASKPLAFLRLEVGGDIFGLSATDGSTVLMDLADLFQVTPEGKAGWVTFWIDVDGELALSDDPGIPILVGGTMGVMDYKFDFLERARADDRKEYILQAGAHFGGFAITYLATDQTGPKTIPRLQWTGSMGTSVYVKGTIQGLASFEVNIDSVAWAIQDAFVGKDSLRTALRQLSKNIIQISSTSTRTATMDDGDWPLTDGQWAAELRLLKSWNQTDKYAHYFSIDVPSGTNTLNVRTIGGGGNADLYVGYGSRPYPSPQYASTNANNYESVNVSSPTAGTWYIMLPATKPYAGVSLVASLDAGTLSLDKESVSLPSMAGSFDIQVASTNAWTVSTNCGWLTPMPTAGSGDSTIMVSYTANNAGALRKCIVTVTDASGSDTVLVSQKGTTVLEADPSSITAGSEVDTIQIAIMSNTSWTATSSANWLTIIGASGSMDGSIGVSFLKNVDVNGRSTTIEITGGGATATIHVIQLGTSVDVEDGQQQIPSRFLLAQNYPNPFNPATTISFSLPSKAFVSLKVFDILGKEVAFLVSKELAAGSYKREWNADGMPSGIYFYRLQADSYIETKKLVLLR